MRVNSPALLLPSDEDRRKGVSFWAAIVVLTVLAAVPRLYGLGYPGLSGNEDYAAIAARAIREGGVPRFPSGVIYPRALLMSYATAGSTWLLGPTELATRLPSALLSALCVAVAYVFARRVFGRHIALLAALFLALSSWEITTARTARMYAPLSITFLIALYSMHKVAFENDGRFRVPNLVATIAACSLHQLGAVLAVPYAVVFLMRTYVVRRAFLLTALVVVVLAAGAQILFEKRHYADFERRVVALHAPSDLAEAAASRPEEPSVAPMLDHAGFLRSRPLALAVFVCGLALAIGLRRAPWSFSAAVVTTILLAGMQKLALASYAAAAFLAWLAFARRRWSWREASVLGGILTVGAVVWLGFLVAGPSRLSPGRAVRLLAGFPPNFLEFFARRSAAVFGVALVGMLVVLAGFFREKRSFAPHVLVVSAFALSATALGFSPSASRHFDDRYVVHLDPYFAFLVAAGTWWIVGQVADVLVRGESRVGQRRVVSMVLAVGMMLATGAISPSAAPSATLQHYGKNEGVVDVEGGDWFVPDNAGASTFACAEAAAGDFIVPMDILIHYVYCPRADVQLTMSHKGDAEGWIGSRSVHTLREVGAALERSRAQRIWLVLSGQAINFYRAEDGARLSSAMSFTTWDCARRAYSGRDGLSDVWVMDRECFLRHVSPSTREGRDGSAEGAELRVDVAPQHRPGERRESAQDDHLPEVLDPGHRERLVQ